MKISWGIKIIISFVIFAAGIITMVAISMSSTTDLVSENYYEQEIKYQDRIDILNNSVELDRDIVIDSDRDGFLIKISDPQSRPDLKGEIHFYRTSDAAKDFKTEFNPDINGQQRIYSPELDKGLWKVILSLADGNRKYYVEKKVFKVL